MKIINLSFVMLVLSVGELIACSCTPEASAPTCQKVSDTAVIFLGERINDSSHLFKIDQVYKGLPVGTKKVTVVPGIGSCSTRYEPGVKYLIFASVARDNVVFSGMCSGSHVADESDIRFLNDFVAGKTQTIVHGKVLQFVTHIGYPKDTESAPLGNVEIVLEGLTKKYNTRSNQDGSFSFVDVLPGQYKLRASLEPYTPSPEFQPFELVKGGCRIVYPQLKAMASLSGKAVDSDGHPLKRTRIEMIKKSWLAHWYHTHKMWTQTDDEGNFQFDDLESGDYVLGHEVWGDIPSDNTPYPLFYYPNATEMANASIIKLAPRQKVADIKLVFFPKHTERRLTIRVVGPDGKAPGSHLLQIFNESGLVQNLEGRESKGKIEFVAYEERSYTFRARYWVDDLSDDKIQVKRLLLAEPVTLAPGKTKDEIVLRLTRAVLESDVAFDEY